MSTAATTETEQWSALQWAGAILGWLWVLVPFGYGLYQLLIKIPALFGG